MYLPSPFTSLPQHSEDRRRLGKNLKQVWLFALAFHFFAASQRRQEAARHKNSSKLVFSALAFHYLCPHVV